MGRLNLVLFGSFRATIGARTVSLPLKKAQALLGFLALAPGQRHARERLATLLWGDAGDEHARNSLRQTLFAIRAALGRSSSLYLGGDPATVWLVPGAIDVDVLAFERFIAEDTDDALARAAALYHGDLLDGLPVEADAFDEWLAPARQRLRHAATTALAKLLERQGAAGSIEAAIATSTRLLSIDPLQEVAHRAVIQMYARTGRRAEAIRQYQAFVDLLRRELQTEPEPATVQVYRALLGEEPAPAAAPSVTRRQGAAADRTPFVARDAELAALAHHLRLAAGGSGRVVAVLGEAGVGKTRLTEELVARIPPDRVLHLQGRSYESSRALPFALWAEALRDQAVESIRELQSLGHAWARELEALFPDTRRARARATRGGDRLRLFEALAHYVRWLASGRTVLVVLEDLHWADDMSLRLLAFLGRRLAAWSVLVVATARAEELAEREVATLGELARERRLHELPLVPLSMEDTAALVRSLMPPGAAPADLAGLQQHVWRVSDGNPFVATEMMRTMRPGHGLPWESGVTLPDTVRAMTRSRVQRLSDLGRRLMAIAAVVGREFDLALLQGASGAAELETAEAVEELVRAHLLRERGDRFEIVHDRIREVVAGDLLPARRRALHVAVARAL
ncbi:MAG: ATP-binding protein, partial [Candidatus Rokuibacteriota bacterium]